MSATTRLNSTNVQPTRQRRIMPLRLKGLLICALGLLVNSGCGDADRVAGPKEQEENTLKLVKDDDNNLFGSPPRIFKLSLDIEEKQLETLKRSKDSHPYIRCTVREGGKTLTGVGI